MNRRVALVTGASSGIGAQTALRLRREGFEVYAAARRADKMTEALAPHGVHVLGMDLTDDGTMTTGIDRILDEAGGIDVLVNNAGYGSYGAIEDVPIAEARRQFEVNLFGLARLIQLVTPTMREQGSGRIINVSSIAGRIYTPLGGWYHATKYAVEGLSDSLRLELAPYGIDVIVIEPGPIKTEWNAIARDHLVQASRGGAYADRAERVRAGLARFDEGLLASSAGMVARKIVHAAVANTPKSRYPVGRGAGTAVRARKLLPDLALDAVLGRMFR